MASGVFLIKENNELVALPEQPYDSEDLLQTLLAKYPSILAGDQINPSAPRRWLLVRREVGVPCEAGGGDHWSLDHLFLDQDGIPTLVEVKRGSDTRIRREVVGQMLDYAANAVAYWSIEAIRAGFERTCEENHQPPEEMLVEFLGSETSPESFWQAVKTNLAAGRLRLLFVADEIPDELRRIIEFLNSQMDPAEVLGIEIKQFAAASLKTLVPRVVGQTAEAERHKNLSSRPVRQWDEVSFFTELTSKGYNVLASIAQRILDWARPPRVSRIYWGGGTDAGSFVPIFQHGCMKHQLFRVHTGWGNSLPGLETQFQYQANKPPFDDPNKRRELLRRFNQIPGVNLSQDAIDRRPSIPLKVFESDFALNQLFSVMQWYLDEVQKT